MRPRPTFWFGQIKNNLSHKAAYSWVYHIEGVEVGWDTRKDVPIISSHIIFDGIKDGNVEDLYREQEKAEAKKGKDTSGNRAERWLEGYIGNRSIPRKEVLEAGADQLDFSSSTLKRAFADLNGQTSPMTGSRDVYWRLPHLSNTGY